MRLRMASVRFRRPTGSLAGRALLAVAVIAGRCGEAPAAGPASACGNAIAILNEGKVYEAFDKLNGGGDKRLRFRLDGQEPCPAGHCKAEGKAETTEGNVESKPDAKAERDGAIKPDAIKPERSAAGNEDGEPQTNAQTKVATKVEIIAGFAAAEKVIATIDLRGRSVSYCVYELSRVDTRPDPRRTGSCPRSYLRNFLAIKLVDGDGPFARRDVDIHYLYRPDPVTVSLDHCASPAILDGMFRRRLWTVPLEDGAAAYIGETDFPRDRRAPVPPDAPFATTISGANPE
jgi:hypothetical protein